MISGIYTAILLLVFLAIVAWAFNKSNKDTFEDMAHMALKDDDHNQEEVNHE